MYKNKLYTFPFKVHSTNELRFTHRFLWHLLMAAIRVVISAVSALFLQGEETAKSWKKKKIWKWKKEESGGKLLFPPWSYWEYQCQCNSVRCGAESPCKPSGLTSTSFAFHATSTPWARCWTQCSMRTDLIFQSLSCPPVLNIIAVLSGLN